MAIKSFQGERETKKKVEQPTVLVKDIMTTNLVLFTVEQSIHEVMNAFIKNKISGGPVAVSYTHLRAHETLMNLVCRLLLEKSTGG